MIAAQVAQIDESQPIAEILEMRDLVEADLARPRFPHSGRGELTCSGS
jgi:hypothetical protein